MNNVEYKKAYKNISPSEELISNTVLKIKNQKRNKVLKLYTYLEITVAACFCLFVGLWVSKFTFVNIDTNSTVGSVFGKGSPLLLATLIFVISTAVIVIIYRRRKK